MMRRLAPLAVLAACTGSPGRGPNDVTLTISGSPTLVAYRDGAGATGRWHDADPGTRPGDYVLHVTDAYEAIITCSDANGFSTKLRRRTFADGDWDFVWCDGHDDPTHDVTVTGGMKQPGFVSMFDFALSSASPWSFSLVVPPGVHDLGATGDGHFAIRRNLAIGASQALPPIDVDAEGAPLVSVPLVVEGAPPGATITTEIDDYTANDVVFGATIGGTTALAPPSSLLVPDDQLDLFVDVVTPTTARTADTWFTGVETTLALMPALTGVSFDARADGIHVSWGELPSHDGVALDLAVLNNTTTQFTQVSASQSYLDATGAIDLAFPSPKDLPARFQSAWTVDLAQPYTRTFTASDGSTGIEYESKVWEDINGGAPRTAPRARRAPLQVIGASRRILP